MPQILDQLVNNQLTIAAGRSSGLSGDGEVRRRVGEIEDLIIGQIYLQRAIDERVTDAQVETAYQDFLNENPPERQLKARHILVETEEAAKEVIVALDRSEEHTSELQSLMRISHAVFCLKHT